ncbi:MAG TPA: hypothetical protein VGO45_05105 [Bacteroidia bacterium]|jgi:hypothetical protein|nr:hypothetical protein [Bacteroidia bacterium]
MEKIITDIAELYFLEDGIFCTRLLQDKEIDIDKAKANFAESRKLTGDSRYTAFTDARGFMSITKEAMAYGGTKEVNDPVIAHAILVNSLANRLLGNFLIKFYKPPAPTRLFTNEEEALGWLREKLEEDNMNKDYPLKH